MRRCIVVMLLLLATRLYATEYAYIDWLSNLDKQGIELSTEDWQTLVKKPSRKEVDQLVMKYAHYVESGRLDRKLFQPGWYIEEPDSLLSAKNQLSISELKALQSSMPQYPALIKSLAVMEKWQQTAVTEFPDQLIFFEGDQHPTVARLNQWLLDLDLVDELSGDIYTQTHKDILTQVQLKFDLGPDGRLGVLTRQALLAITNDRIRTLKANLERMRWLPNQLPYPHIKVDITGYKVDWAESRKKSTLYPAIVGTRFKQTPIFNDEIKSITYNPVWKVPHSIAARSMLRAEKKQPGFFKKEGFVVYENWDDRAPVINPETVKWQKLTPRTFRYRLEQQPGAVNRLGKFKLDLPNSFGVYLHDTDKPELFDKQRRSFSSGCTRVKGIDQLIAQILALQESFKDKHKDGSPTFTRTLSQKIPVYFMYFTAWPDVTGRVRFREDIYQLDNALTSWF
ncbi:hypothetical protein EOPP23_17805 [Endozoicomonas sp. OPT23]|uniref:L,D-transpeptidase family protein n=1 Tax=Endozoicomonas sp. OPT23 TaxID=2072845 RepID=UPI00129B08C6|nr:L,D-transpeptidase family protein [Endozoicomonas sp. OPT23]MRI34835.1 hypothetical protein [Endozoicomonas sp. OPT23]